MVGLDSGSSPRREKSFPLRMEGMGCSHPLRGVPEAVVNELKAGVESGRWATAEAARIWLKRERGIKRP